MGCNLSKRETPTVRAGYSIHASEFYMYDTQIDVYKLPASLLRNCVKHHLHKFDDNNVINDDMINKIYNEYCYDVPYHNFHHVFCVFQMALILLEKVISKNIINISNNECLVFLLICLCHDIGHDGSSNSKISMTIKDDFPYWGKSKMEKMHYEKFIGLMRDNAGKYYDVLFSDNDRIKELFKSTDLPEHLNVMKHINSDTDKYKKENILQVILLFSDINGCVRNKEYGKIICKKLENEIKMFHSDFPALKNKMLDGVSNQNNFIDVFVQPLAKYLSEIIIIDDVISTELI